jgi:single-stranded DNA-binding protein
MTAVFKSIVFGRLPMNKVCINGRIIKETAFKELENNNALCTFFIANDVHHGSGKKTGFYKVTAWGNQARIIAEHAKVGSELFITGRLDQYTYEDENKKTVYDVSILLEHFDFGHKPVSVPSIETSTDTAN